eukprot:TRINITY_DN5739_c0_g1_i2.p1 TRINITY_DN5739_c0_g1~~TRINITY_DN5739_c0_g1_i2.p1  ORF type:complete len:308 (-),score=77.45 TRINITY_DN5739_c0_g1_i2:245-1168(-)
MVKAGMTHDWNEWGIYVPLTVLQMKDCIVIGHKTEENDGYTAMQLGIHYKRPTSFTKAQKGLFAKNDVPPRRIIQEFHCSPEALLPPGTPFEARHFVAGQHVDVAGVTIGKGYQGTMKRHGFRGMSATHGTGTVHRSVGATGARQDPGKVWKGKKMPGQMGNKHRTILNLLVYEVDVENNCILVQGSVMGKAGNVVRVTDAHGFKFEFPPPFPTFTQAFLPRYTNPKMHEFRLTEGGPIHSYYHRFTRPWGKDFEEQPQADLYERTAEAAREQREAEELEAKKARERAEKLRRMLEATTSSSPRPSA